MTTGEKETVLGAIVERFGGQSMRLNEQACVIRSFIKKIYNDEPIQDSLLHPEPSCEKCKEIESYTFDEKMRKVFELNCITEDILNDIHKKLMTLISN